MYSIDLSPTFDTIELVSVISGAGNTYKSRSIKLTSDPAQYQGALLPSFIVRTPSISNDFQTNALLRK